ncbi:MAG: prepilin-type N-terminal cleavage/methylation domain-containing protein [Azonexus sp.]|jgi:MSHA pilin protein MshC|nr:prepilin-type N-terminal cleavage/methylation domain-containing protein [Azonexus sp.]
MIRHSAGFTMLELVAVILVVSILAAVALPNLRGGDQNDIVFRDQVVSALRYAQKTAVSHRRQVCVAFTATTVTLTIETVSNGGCNANLPLPGGQANSVASREPSTVQFNPAPPNGAFTAEGWWNDGCANYGCSTTLTIQGFGGATIPITVEGTTGYVN